MCFVPQSDLWSCGITAIEMAEGAPREYTPPFRCKLNSLVYFLMLGWSDMEGNVYFTAQKRKKGQFQQLLEFVEVADCGKTSWYFNLTIGFLSHCSFSLLQLCVTCIQ